MKTALIILDGFGITPETKGNAILQAKTPVLDELISTYPKCLLKASSEEVGLPWGEAGNSEVGHSNIGLGRVVLQDLPQIDRAIKDSTIENKVGIVKAKEYLAKNPANLNVIFLASDGAVHGHIRHLKPIIDIFKSTPIKKIILHLIADGRDVGEKSLSKYVEAIKPLLSQNIVIGSLSGRYFAMDRDKNYDRTKLAYEAILGKSPKKYNDINEAINFAYQAKESDEFITPVSFPASQDVDLANDVFIFTNYRADRSLQLTRSFVDAKFEDFKRDQVCANFITMTTYDDNLPVAILFSNLDLFNKETNSLKSPLCEAVSRANLRQFHVAETEKYAHVTYFFSGTKDVFSNQENKLIQSDKVKSYDLKPEMQALQIALQISLQAEKETDFILANIANGDMVGHSGNLDAAIKAVEIIDQAIGQITKTLLNKEYCVFICADHGNCDQMIDPQSGKIDKEHSINPVPFIYVCPKSEGKYQSKDDFFASDPIGILGDIAPTVASALGIGIAPEMTGMNLIDSLL